MLELYSCEADLVVCSLKEMCSPTALSHVQLKEGLGRVSHCEHHVPGFSDSLPHLAVLGMNQVVEFASEPCIFYSNGMHPDDDANLVSIFEESTPWHQDLDLEIDSLKGV
jgi:hypothetical protein